jgi:peptidoglycan/LPS O-acetylase OafA/YrhL
MNLLRLLHLLLLPAVISSNKCSSILSDEGQSLIQLLIGDHTNQKLQSIAAQQLAYSGKDLNDLGHWSSCTRLKNSHYLVVDFQMFPPFQSKVGLCVPKECSAGDLKKLITSGSLKSHPVLKSSWSSDKIKVFKPETDDATFGVYLAWFFVAALILVIAYGTYLDIKLTPPKKQEVSVEMGEPAAMPEAPAQQRRLPKYVVLLQCFSFTKNWNSLFFRPFSDSTVILDAVRAISILWVVSSHVKLTRLMDLMYNIEDLTHAYKNFFLTVLASGTLAVDGFFWLSGFLLGYLILDEAAKKKGRINWGMAIVARLLRLWPTYIFTLILVNFLVGNIGEGPKWDQVEDVLQADCSKYWWTNLLFINNIYPWYVGNDCIGQSWYMAADVQIFLMIIPCVIVYLKFPKHYGWIFLGLVIALCFVYRIVVSFHYKIIISVISRLQVIKHYKKLHQSSISRVTPYFIGLFSGFLMNLKKTGKSNDAILKLIHQFYQSKIRSYISFVIGFALFVVVLYIPYNVYADGENDFLGYSREGNYTFNGFYNLISSLSYSFMLIPILYEQIPALQTILSLDLWVPIAKSSFSIYFVHITIIRTYVASEESASLFTNMNIFTDMIFLGFVSVVAGMLVFVAVENPFGKLIKILMTPARPARKEQPLIPTELKDKAIN